LLTRQSLITIKVRALRRKIWFRALSKVERSIVDLTIRCVDNVRSPVLLTIVSSIVNKILKTLRKGFLETVEKIGREVAERVYTVALYWGNASASDWKHDLDFVRFLGVNAIGA